QRQNFIWLICNGVYQKRGNAVQKLRRGVFGLFLRDGKESFGMDERENKNGGLNKSLKLIFVYTVATGSIFTFVNYWDSVFYGYCGSGTFLAFALMTVAILPVALVYSELASL